MAEEQMEYVRMKSDSDFFYKAGSVLFVSGFLYVAATLFHTQLDQLLVVIVVFARLWPVFTGLQASLQQLASSLPAFESVERLQTEAGRASENLQPHSGKLALARGIECRDVSFRYGGEGAGDALDSIRLFVPANGMTAVVGRSGAGKSTLVDALTGLVQPQRGEVLWDGQSFDAIDVQALRNSIGYVPQDPYLFNGSIRANLTLAKPDASEDELWEALEFASAAAFVRRLSEGLDAEIGDRGVRLSGGERQRLVLARAMLRKPSILVLDEATSALDTENETVIQRALERLKGRTTVIVIAHRLSTVRSADQVIVLDEGRIVQSGGYAELAGEAGGLFRTLLGGGRKETSPPDGGANEKLLTRSL
jgi:ATP-binding cassette subfamily C protein